MSFGQIFRIESNGANFFTMVFLPEREGKFPTVVLRSPYVSSVKDADENELLNNLLNGYNSWLTRGYAVVFQHCRGCGKSSGDFVPYINEHEDSRALRQWIRKQPFYDGTLLLMGGSYTASLHYSSAPFEDDIKAAVFEVQDTNRYRLWYRNGQMRKGHANWHFGLFKQNSLKKPGLSIKCFSNLPTKDLSKRVLGETAEDFEQMLTAQNPEHPFWNTRFGGKEAKDSTDNLSFPTLFTTGYNDFYLGGMFDMWRKMSTATKKRCAMLVSPYDHGDGFSKENGLSFENGRRCEQFGPTYQIDWFDHVLKGTELPYKKGVITYYRAFENRWESDFYSKETTDLVLKLGERSVTFNYNPLSPPAFSAEGTFQNDFSDRNDVITVYTYPFEKDVFVKGTMKANLTFSSNCNDTSVYVAVSIEKPQGDYVLKHDITSLCYVLGTYTPGNSVTLDFKFDEHAFLIGKGERLRIDISSTDDNTYLCHTNNKGPYYLQTETKIAENTVFLDRSQIVLPIE